MANNALGTTVSGLLSSTNLRSFYVTNANASKRYLQFFNLATLPISTSIPVSVYEIPAGSSTSSAALVLGNDFFVGMGDIYNKRVAWGISTTQATFTAATASDHLLEIR